MTASPAGPLPPLGPTSPGPAVVALGGGHGLAASLSALRHVTSRLTAVVTVADNGGSSGRLRRELGVLPPGDLRMALAALCGDDGWGRTWASALQHRFRSQGDLHDHVVGNLLIVALWELLETSGAPDAHVAGLDWVARLLDARGRVLPMSAVPLDVVAEVRGADRARPDEVEQVRGQVEVATTVGQVQSIGLDPPNPPACGAAVAAVRDADCVVIGPGSWFTSVLVHLLVPDLSSAVHETSGRRVLTLNLAPQRGETDGLSPEAHLAALAAHAPDLPIDVVLADESVAAGATELPALVERLGARLVLADVASVDDPTRHDVLRLAAAYREICSTTV